MAAPEFPEFAGQNWGNVDLAGGQGYPPDAPGYASPSHQARPPPAQGGLNKNSQLMISTFEAADPFTLVCVIGACSFIVMCQSAVECNGKWTDACEDEYVYAIVVGVLSFIVSIIVVAWAFCAEALFEQFAPVIACFYLAWWGFGTFVTTNRDPFSNSGNGYFASWAALIVAFVMLGSVSRSMRRFLGSAITRVIADTIEARLSMGIMVASVVLLIAVSFEANYENLTAQELWGIVCAVVSFFFILMHTVLRLCCENITCHPTIFGAALSIWWLAAVAVLTFDEPFKTSGNGYFACWFGFVFSVWLALEGVDGYGGIGWTKRKVGAQIKTDQAAAGMGMEPNGAPAR